MQYHMGISRCHHADSETTRVLCQAQEHLTLDSNREVLHKACPSGCGSCVSFHQGLGGNVTSQEMRYSEEWDGPASPKSAQHLVSG